MFGWDFKTVEVGVIWVGVVAIVFVEVWFGKLF